MRRWGLALALAAGCYRPTAEAPCRVTCDHAGAGVCPGALVCMADDLCHEPGGGCGGEHVDGPPGDLGLIDRSGGPPYCFGKQTGKGLFEYCAPALSDDVSILPSFINTASDALCVIDVLPACVLYARAWTLDTTGMRVEGPRPLVIVATDTITVGGVLDAASHVTGMPGAASNPGSCAPLMKAQPSNGGGKGGGAGGTSQGRGGDGGSAGSDGTGAVAQTPTAPTVVRGGCSGDLGVAPNPCTPGRGGGAVYLIAGTSITIASGGTINASGGGASAGGTSGCGGGAGGMIGLDAPRILNDGILMAIGGGGSSGANVTVQGGSDPSSPDVGGSGGGNNSGGPGGPGAGGSVLAGFAGGGVTSLQFGGGGGGGAGWILVYGGGAVPYVSARVGPPPTTL